MLWIWNDFSGSIRILLYSWFRILHEFFLIFIQKFTIEFPSCNFWDCILYCGTVQAFYGNFVDKKEFIFFNWTFFCWEIVKYYQIFHKFLCSNSFLIRSCPDPEWFFRIHNRILLKVSDPTGFWSTTLVVRKIQISSFLLYADSKPVPGTYEISVLFL